MFSFQAKNLSCCSGLGELEVEELTGEVEPLLLLVSGAGESVSHGGSEGTEGLPSSGLVNHGGSEGIEGIPS